MRSPLTLALVFLAPLSAFAGTTATVDVRKPALLTLLRGAKVELPPERLNEAVTDPNVTLHALLAR